ncbi:DUF3291 domain-containing protein [Wenxinia marina]|uniref:DUF3291 domain-containing protein n=1 Tax=Wenxinia marina DSM 24838 TaxID=1123501 RepID=A0A0D0NNN3_9RHOB|nr:DUF3291 domain-containing protein [Wenxinia marina]KIQ69880.1 hypothetical protein Wenmar_01450 [Wenxinia marina DSM 24838]GGL61948.1 hypothetical protein GCM10011392_15540 [Wenxinia marina]
MPLAEFNRGILLHDWDDPRVAPFVNALAQVNLIAQRTPGFVWRLDDAAMERAQTDPASALGPDPRLASTLSVWTDAPALHHFVFRTLHRAFYVRGHEWFVAETAPRVVMWFVPEGHRPTPDEAADRYARLCRDGEGAEAFGWAWLRAEGHLMEAAE